MPRTVACFIVRTAKVFSWLGHMPIMNWSLTQLTEVRGVDRIVCVAAKSVAEQTKKLLANEKAIETTVIPQQASNLNARAFDEWLVSAAGPASDAEILLVIKPTSPFLPAGKIEACLNHVSRGRCVMCYPARDAAVVIDKERTKTLPERLEGVRVMRVKAPAEGTGRAIPTIQTVPLSLMESLDVEVPDEFLLASALVESGKI